MDFKGGAIIIGSLLWENKPARKKWRTSFLEPIENKIFIKLRIRYGRESTTRKGTYTMILSNHPETKFGQGIILPFKESIKNARALESQAFAMAGAEGLWKATESSLNKSWGTVGLLINPNLKETKGLEIIRERWSKIYANYQFEAMDYSISDEPKLIDKNGILDLEWMEEMNGFDFLIATLTVPKPKRLLSGKEIAERMIEKRYTEYFDGNLENQIESFQDKEIETILRRR